MWVSLCVDQARSTQPVSEHEVWFLWCLHWFDPRFMNHVAMSTTFSLSPTHGVETGGETESRGHEHS